MTDLIGSREAAEILGWSLAKVKREALNGALPVALKMDGGTGAYLFDRGAITALAEGVTA
jgi:hypothetical protein